MDLAEVARLPVPDKSVLMNGVASARAMAEALTIDSPAMLDIAAEELRSYKTQRDAFEKKRKELTGPLDQLKKSIMDLFREPVEALDAAESILKRKIADYNAEQVRIQREQQRLLEEAAAKERARLAAEAAKAQGKADALRAAETPKAEARAEVAEQKAEALRMQAAMTFAPVAPTAVEKPKGVSMSEKWEADVTDPVAFVQWLAANPQFVSVLDFKKIEMNKLASFYKTTPVPGVKIRCETKVSARKVA